MPERARLAGLRYVTDSQPGVRRKRAGRGFSYIGVDGKPIHDRNEIRRVKSLVIPPAWTDVWICPRPNGHIQATGRDAKGRKQYRYHTRYREVRDETKFDRMLAFSEVLPTVRVRVERDLRREGLPREKVLATVVRLLEKTLIRIGSDVYAKENRSYGLTTMRRSHVDISGSTLTFEFTGKSGVEHFVEITDRRLASIVQHCQTLPGQELFQYLDERGRHQDVDSGDINAYLREITGQDFTAKDFRTWAGTTYAALALRVMGPAQSQRELKSNVNRAIDMVAERLGNTRAVCRKYYVHPRVIEAYARGVVAATPSSPGSRKRRRRRAQLRRDEVAVLDLVFPERKASGPRAGAAAGGTPARPA